jgi:NADP-dependent 3-hydroxy acid dehydrogenase YdfG
MGETAAVMLAEGGAKVVLGARGLDRLETLARRIAGARGEVAEFTDCPICLPIVNALP